VDTKKLITAGISSFIVMFSLSGLWYMVLAANYYSEQYAVIERAAPLFAWIVLAYLVLSFLLAYIYPFGFKGNSPMKEGLRFGFIMGLVIALPMGFIYYAVYTFPLSGTLIDIIYQVVEKTIGGGVIGFVYGSSAKVE
jgi:hypothetical protein